MTPHPTPTGTRVYASRLRSQQTLPDKLHSLQEQSGWAESQPSCHPSSHCPWAPWVPHGLLKQPSHLPPTTASRDRDPPGHHRLSQPHEAWWMTARSASGILQTAEQLELSGTRLFCCSNASSHQKEQEMRSLRNEGVGRRSPGTHHHHTPIIQKNSDHCSYRRAKWQLTGKCILFHKTHKRRAFPILLQNSQIPTAVVAPLCLQETLS